MQITYFFRKRTDGFHSIETLFYSIRKALPADITHKAYYATYKSALPIFAFINGMNARKNSNDINHITGDVNYLALFLNRKRTILTIHDLEIIKRSTGFKKWFIKLFWFTIPVKISKYITVISEFTKGELLQEIDIDPNKVIVIPNCLTVAIQPTVHIFNSEKPVIFQIGTKKNKNLETLICAIADINCRLIIVGKLTDKHLKLLTDLKIDYENHFNLKFYEIVDIYKRADIISFISTYEGFGLPVLEGNAAGRPVLAANVAAIPEAAGNAALYVDPYDINSVRAGITSLFKNKELRESLIQSGFENIKNFAPEVIAAKYVTLYERIINEAGL